MADKLRVEIMPVISTASIKAELKKIDNLIKSNAMNIPLKPINRRVRDSVDKTKNSFDELVGAIGKVAIWTVATSAIFGTVRALKMLVREFVELQDQLIAIERVTKDLDLSVLFDKSLEAAIELGVGLKDVLAIVEELGRTYADLDETQLKLASSNAVLLASVTDLTSQSAVSGLIAITQAYNIAISDSIGVVDALNVVNNNYAIGAADLSKSLERSASAAAEVGVSFENLIGYTTAIKTSTRESGSVIGNSLKTIMIRLQSNSEALREVQQAGVAVYGEDGQLRRAEDIISDLAGKWDTLSKNQKVNIGVAAAGQRQYTRFAALMQNYDIAVEAANDAVSNQGNALEENEKRLKTVSAQATILGNSVLDLANSFGGMLAPAMIIILKVTKGVISALTWVIDTFGKGTLAIIAITAVLLKLPTLIHTVNAAIRLLSITLARLLVVAPILIFVAAVTYAVNAIQKMNDQREEALKIQKESLKALKTEGETIAELEDRYIDLKKSSNLSKRGDAELLEVQKKLAELLPTLTTLQDAYGNTVLVSTDLLRKELEVLEKINLAKATSDIAKLSKEIAGAKDEIELMFEVEKSDSDGGLFAFLEAFLPSSKSLELGVFIASSIEDINEALENGEISYQVAQDSMDELGKLISKNSELFADYSQAVILANMGTLDMGAANMKAVSQFRILVAEEELVIENLVEVSDAFEQMIIEMEAGADSTEALSRAFQELGFDYNKFVRDRDNNGIDPFTVSELNEMDLFNNVMEDTFGVTKDTISAVEKALEVFRLYKDQTSLSITQQNEYIRVIGTLSDIFPELGGNIEENIDVIDSYSKTWNMAVESQEAYVNMVTNGVVPVSQELFDKTAGNIAILEKETARVKESIMARRNYVVGLAAGSAELVREKSLIASEINLFRSLESRLAAINKEFEGFEAFDPGEIITAGEAIAEVIALQQEMHSEFISELDAEKNAFSDLVDHQIDELDRLNDAAKHDEKVSALTEEQVDLENKIARLQQDTSIEGITKRRRLEEELADSKKDLDDELRDRELTLRRDNLESIQQLVMDSYDDRIAREKELNEIIKERISEQSEALKNDVEALSMLQNILSGTNGEVGIGGFLESLRETGLFNLEGVSPIDTSSPMDEINEKQAQRGIFIEKVVISGKATNQDGKDFVSGIIDYAETNRVLVKIK